MNVGPFTPGLKATRRARKGSSTGEETHGATRPRCPCKSGPSFHHPTTARGKGIPWPPTRSGTDRNGVEHARPANSGDSSIASMVAPAWSRWWLGTRSRSRSTETATSSPKYLTGLCAGPTDANGRPQAAPVSAFGGTTATRGLQVSITGPRLGADADQRVHRLRPPVDSRLRHGGERIKARSWAPLVPWRYLFERTALGPLRVPQPGDEPGRLPVCRPSPCLGSIYAVRSAAKGGRHGRPCVWHQQADQPRHLPGSDHDGPRSNRSSTIWQDRAGRLGNRNPGGRHCVGRRAAFPRRPLPSERPSRGRG